MSKKSLTAVYESASKLASSKHSIVLNRRSDTGSSQPQVKAAPAGKGQDKAKH